MANRHAREEGMSISPPPTKRRRKESPPPVSPVLADSTLTIYSWNVNGIAPFLQRPITSFFSQSKAVDTEDSAPKASLREFLRRHDWPHVLFLQEVKINPSDRVTMRQVESCLKPLPGEPDDTPRYDAHFCLPSDKFNARGFGGKVYGVCSIVRKDLSRRYIDAIRPVEWDLEGRFLIIETKQIDEWPKLAIINIYAVNGTENDYRDPVSGKVSGTRHDRKLEVHRQLQNEVRSLEAKGFSVVIAGDVNIARTTLDGHPSLRTYPMQHCVNRADFESRFFSESKITAAEPDGDSGLAMIDTFRHLHPDKKGYTFYPRTRKFGDSCDRVDIIMVSRSLEACVHQAGMHETARDRGPSDHVPLYVTLKSPADTKKRSSHAS